MIAHSPLIQQSLVELDGVSKIYHMGEVEVAALRHTSLTVQAGEFIVILGPSGCGKSTLMNLIGGLDSPSTGRIVVQGKDIETLDDQGLTRYRRDTVGFVFQFFNLVTTLTARENVELAADLSPDPLDIDEVLKSVGLSDRGHHFPSELSGGEQQRVAIARALVKHVPLLLCDEPTGELDFETGRRILSLLHATTHERGQTVLMVTHNSAIGEMADRVVKLRNGEVVSDEWNSRPINPMDLNW